MEYFTFPGRCRAEEMDNTCTENPVFARYFTFQPCLKVHLLGGNQVKIFLFNYLKR